MKMIIVALALVAVAAAASVPGESQQVQILRSQFDQNPDGGYSFGFDSEDKISRKEEGEVKEVLDEEKKPHSVIVVRGSYTYTDTEGNEETINYTADETGYHPEGKSIPQVPSRR